MSTYTKAINITTGNFLELQTKRFALFDRQYGMMDYVYSHFGSVC